MAFPLIKGSTQVVAHIGYPTHSFKAPMIYNPYFEQAGVDAVVVLGAADLGEHELFAVGFVIAVVVDKPENVVAAGNEGFVAEHADAVRAVHITALVEDGGFVRLHGDSPRRVAFRRDAKPRDYHLQASRRDQGHRAREAHGRPRCAHRHRGRRSAVREDGGQRVHRTRQRTA